MFNPRPCGCGLKIGPQRRRTQGEESKRLQPLYRVTHGRSMNMDRVLSLLLDPRRHFNS